jgi:integrase
MPGHIRQRGDAWELRVYVGRDPTTGRKKYLTRTFRGGKRAAEQELAKLVVEVGGGGHSSQDTTVSDLIDQWLELITPERSPTTARGYRWIVDHYILPALGEVPLSKLKPAQLDTFYGNLRTNGGSKGQPLSPASVRQVHAILRTSLNQAVKWGWLASNPVLKATPPRIRRPEIVPPEPADVLRLIAEADIVDPDLGAFLRTSCATGARRGELCALRWRDVDLKGRRVVIAHNLVEGKDGELVEKDTKTHAARRIALDDTTVEVLREHKKRMEVRAKACGATIGPDCYAFTRSVDGIKPWVPNEVTKVFIQLRDRVGLTGVRLHDLRHFAATRLLAAGVPVRTVSGRLGHANAATTLGVYAHFVEESDREAADALGAVLKGPKETK